MNSPNLIKLPAAHAGEQGTHAPGASALNPTGDRLRLFEERVQHCTTSGLNLEQYTSGKDVFVIGDMNHGDPDLQLGFLGLLSKLKELGFTTVAVELPPSFREEDSVGALRLPFMYASLKAEATRLGMKIAQVDLEPVATDECDREFSTARGVEMGKNVANLASQGERVVLFTGAAHVDAPDQIRKVLHDREISFGAVFLYSRNQKKHLDDTRPTHITEKVPGLVQKHHPDYTNATVDIGSGFSVGAFLVCEATHAGKSQNSPTLSFNFENEVEITQARWVTDNLEKLSVFVQEMVNNGNLPRQQKEALILALNGYCLDRSDTGKKHPGSIIGIDYRESLDLFIITLVDTGGYQYTPDEPNGIKRNLVVDLKTLDAFNTTAFLGLRGPQSEQLRLGDTTDTDPSGSENTEELPPSQPPHTSLLSLSTSGLIPSAFMEADAAFGKLEIYAPSLNGARWRLILTQTIDDIPLSAAESAMRALARIAQDIDHNKQRAQEALAVVDKVLEDRSHSPAQDALQSLQSLREQFAQDIEAL